MRNEQTTTLALTLESLDWPRASADELARSAHVIHCERGTTIFHAGEPDDLVYLLLDGEAKLYYDSEHGERLIVAIARPGQLLAFPELEANGATQHSQVFTASALSVCSVALITKAQFSRVASDLCPERVIDIMRHTNRGWASMARRMLSFLTMDVRSRLVHVVGEIAESFGIADRRGRLIPLKLSHEDFGELVGASRPMVSKHLKDFATAGVFYKEDGRYILSDLEALRLLATREADCGPAVQIDSRIRSTPEKLAVRRHSVAA